VSKEIRQLIKELALNGYTVDQAGRITESEARTEPASSALENVVPSDLSRAARACLRLKLVEHDGAVLQFYEASDQYTRSLQRRQHGSQLRSRRRGDIARDGSGFRAREGGGGSRRSK
jgi:hypothetical protein